MTARQSLDQIVRGLDGVTAEEAKLKADVARVIDGEAWKAMDDGRDALEGSLWHLRRDWPLEKASQIIGLVSEARSAIPAEATVTALQEALEQCQQQAVIDGNLITKLTSERDALARWKNVRAAEIEYDQRRVFDAESRVRDLEERLAKAAEALEPFAKEADIYDPPNGDDAHAAWSGDFPIGSLRRARTALSQIRSEK